MSSVVIFGVGEIAEIAHCYLTEDSPHDVVAFTVNKDYITSPEFRGLPVVAFEDLETLYPPDQVKLFAPISFVKMNQHRKDKFLEGKARGYSFISFISSRTPIMAETVIGENCFIFENNVIQPKVNIGDNCILWSGNHIGHHTHIGPHTFIASHVVISGHVHTGERCFFGVNATVRDNINIGDETLVGAGALILKSTKPGEVFKGERSRPASIHSNEIKW